MMNNLFGEFPFASNTAKKPIHITKDMTVSYVSPDENIFFSDINTLFFSTEHLTVGIFQLAPGSSYDPADIHEGDEAYYVLNGVLTVQNPETGECIQVNKGESLLIPMYGYHKGYNFQKDVMRTLFAIGPRVSVGNSPVSDFSDGKIKMYKGKYNDMFKKYSQTPEWNVHGTADDIGKWPIPGPEARKAPVFFYHIPENKKLINVFGAQHPTLIKFFVSNDFIHMGEYILPAGGTGSRASEPILHKGDCGLYVETGNLAVYLTKSKESFLIREEELMFIPENTEYQLINYSSENIKVIFCIGPDL